MEKEPRNIFEQLMYALKAINDNIYVVSENIAEMHKKLNSVDEKVDALCFEPIDFSEPTASGSEAEAESEDSDTE